LNTIVQASLTAFEQWSNADPETRATCIEAIADALDHNAESLAEVADRETHLGRVRLVGEVARTTFQLRAFASETRNPAIVGEVHDTAVEGPPPAGRPSFRRVQVPLGPVAVFGAGNFPFAFGDLGGDSASALGAGCTVVVKQHSGYLDTSKRVMSLAREALSDQGMNPDVLTTVSGREAARALVAHPDIEAVGFTGSVSGGRALFDVAVSRPRPIPFYGELGSANPVFITSAALDARAETIAADAAGSISLGRGQFCTKPSLLIIPTHEGFIDTLASALGAVEAGQLLSPGSTSRFAETVGVVASGSGVIEVLPARVDPDAHTVSAGLLRVSAKDFVADHHTIATECFGPMAVVVTCDGEEDWTAVAHVLEGGLVLSVHAEFPADREFVASLYALGKRRFGRVVTNGWPTGVSVTPAQHHGGPYPASTTPAHTSVGLQAVMRFVRPVAFQGLDGTGWDELV
jgi:NADP-dependent aldehyde dehydrogenase